MYHFDYLELQSKRKIRQMCIRNTQQQQIRVESQSESKRNNLNIYCDCSVEQFYLLSSCFFVCVLAIAAIVNMTEH